MSEYKDVPSPALPISSGPAAQGATTPHASLENREGPQASNPYVRLPELPVVLNDYYFERSDALECAWLAPGELKPTPCHDELQTGDASRPHTCSTALDGCDGAGGCL